MPYSVRKKGSKYCVYKKETGEKVGCTAGNKESLRKYLAALHIHEEFTNIKNMKNKPIKLSSLIKLSESHDKIPMTTEQKKAFLEAVYKFAEHSNSIYRSHNIKETARYLGELIEAASNLTLSETEDWFDNVTVGRHMKHLSEAHKIFEKTAAEMDTLQQRLEAAYEDIGSTLNKYYDMGGMVNEASAVAGAGQNYQKFFQKAMKRFKIQEPSDLETDRQKKKFFNWVDANYTSEKERQAAEKSEESENEED